MRKILSTILILLLLITPCNILFACDEKDFNYSTISHEEDIALITLFADNGKSEQKWGLFNLGHSFIGIQNISDEDIYIYNYKISPNESISIGTWSIWEHWGVWFNVESNYISIHNKYDGRLSITTGINNNDLEKLTKYIEDEDKWTLLGNCSYFALNMWNCVSEESEYIDTPLIYSPNYVTKHITQFENHEINRPLETSEIISYYNNTEFKTYTMEGLNN